MNINRLVMEAINQHHYRQNISVGMNVLIVQKQDQKSGKLTSGFVKRLLTSKSRHTRGIKVQLDTGEVGRVQEITKPVSSVSRNVNKFIIHEHRADKVGLHYDIRLERDGVFKSWACRYFPELNSSKKKKILIIGTPDHQLEWFNFEGEISKGYGKGKLIIWDKGTYETIKWEDNSIAIKFNGTKVKEQFAIIPYNKYKKQYLMFRSKV